MDNQHVLLPNNDHPVIDSGTQDLTNEEQQLLDSLAAEWERYEARGLEARHCMGTLLNDQFGPPTVRQTRGTRVLKRAAERLHIAESELSRMSRFAYHFKDVQNLKEQYPTVDAWTQVKALLPSLTPKEPEAHVSSSALQGVEAEAAPTQRLATGTKQRPTRKPRSTDLCVANQFLKNLTLKVRRVNNPTAAAKEAFLRRLEEFVKAVPDCLQVHLSVTRVGREERVAV